MSEKLRGFWKPQNDNHRPADPAAKIIAKARQKERRKQDRARRKKAEKRERWHKTQKKLNGILQKNGERPQQVHPDYRSDEGFYKSAAWKLLRYMALKNADGRCECCGASAADGSQLHVDHIKPRCQEPSLALELTNLQVLCNDCNMGKGGWDSTDWRSHARSIKNE